MIYPTAVDILRCVDQTMLEASDLEMPRMSVKSALATSRHMIRHVELRLQLEASILLEDIDKTTALLHKVVAYLNTVNEASAGLGREIGALLAQAPALLKGTAEDLERISARALALREQVYAALASLQGLEPDVKVKEPYLEIRRLIRGYIAYELEQEARLIGPAFRGKGPRR